MVKDKIIIVCGATGLIGSEISTILFENKAKLILVDKNKDKLAKLRKKFSLKKESVLNLDITKHSNVKKLIKYSNSKFGKIDAAVNCAYPRSKGWGKSFIDINEKFLNQDLRYQLGATIFFSTELTKYFSKQNYGNLILFSSIQGFMAPKFEHYKDLNMKSPIEYSAIKAGIISITKYLAKYFKGKNIRVNCVSPGGIDDNQPLVFKKRYKNSCSSKGMLSPKDISGTILFLLSDNSKYINGQNIIIDDGWSL